MPIFGEVWLWSLLAFVVGVLLTWLVLVFPAQRKVGRLQDALARAEDRAWRAEVPVETMMGASGYESGTTEHARSELVQDFDDWGDPDWQAAPERDEPRQYPAEPPPGPAPGYPYVPGPASGAPADPPHGAGGYGGDARTPYSAGTPLPGETDRQAVPGLQEPERGWFEDAARREARAERDGIGDAHPVGEPDDVDQGVDVPEDGAAEEREVADGDAGTRVPGQGEDDIPGQQSDSPGQSGVADPREPSLRARLDADADASTATEGSISDRLDVNGPPLREDADFTSESGDVEDDEVAAAEEPGQNGRSSEFVPPGAADGPQEEMPGQAGDLRPEPDDLEQTHILPKRQPRRPMGGFDPPQPIQPSIRSTARRGPSEAAEVTEAPVRGSLFTPATPPKGAEPAHPDPSTQPAGQKQPGEHTEASPGGPGTVQPATGQAGAVGQAATGQPATGQPGAGTGQDQAVAPGPFGPGSAMPLPGGRAPSDEFQVKASVTALRYCTPDSAEFDRTVAEVWFRTSADAERVGFRKLT